MTLFFSLLPIYLFGNLHCLGMCGPLILMLGQHRYRYFYFIGRTLSFALAGMLAGEAGAVLNLLLSYYYLPVATSFIFGVSIALIGLYHLVGCSFVMPAWINKRLSSTGKTLSLLILKDRPFATFLFGFFTIGLPCGQTLVVFSACALFGDPWVGLANGFLFAIITSPSLLFAMHMAHLLKRLRHYYNKVFGTTAIIVGLLAICRSLAEMNLISHWIIPMTLFPQTHIVIY